MTDLKILKVKKTDGEIENYDRAKLISSLTNSGADLKESENITAEIDAWLKTLDLAVIKSSEIRAKVLEILHRSYPSIAEKYDSFKKHNVGE